MNTQRNVITRILAEDLLYITDMHTDTNYVLDNLLDNPAYWYGSPAILINMNVSWLEHADLWVLERFPEIYQRFQQKSVSISRIDQYRKESINGVIDHLSRYLERKSKNFEIINLNTLYSSYYHLRNFKMLPKDS